MPNNVPPHRPQPVASSEQRKTMLELAIADKPLFTLDERELRRDTPSWTSQTLQEWREEQGADKPLAFIIGQDSLLTFHTWHRYETILDYAHLLVCRRPGYPSVRSRVRICCRPPWRSIFISRAFTVNFLPSQRHPH